MSGVPEPVLNWLYSALTSEYADVNRTYHDAAEALSHYPSLKTRTDIYTHENGSQALLLILSGTLPVTFRGATYGIPVAIWVPHTYPRQPPMAYVTPEQDMLIRPGQHVSGDGRVYHPYLAQWAKYWDKSTLFDFLAVLRGTFSKEPPVRAKQQQFNAPTPVPQAPPPVPPPPAEWRRSVQGTPAASSPWPADQPPPRPPKPEEARSTPQPQDRYSQPPPLPPHPPQPQQYAPQSSHGQPPAWQRPPPNPSQQQRPAYNPTTSFSRPLRPHVQAQAYQQSYQPGSPVSPITPDDRYQGPAPLQPPQTQTYQGQSLQHDRPPAPQYQPQPPHAYQPHSSYQQQHPLPQQRPPLAQQQQQQPPPPVPQPPVNLLDDSLTITLPSQLTTQTPLPAPPIPPNPEKDALLTALSQTLVAQICSTITSNTSAIPPLLAQQSALQLAHTRLQSELGILTDLANSLAANEALLQRAMADADRVMSEAGRREVPDVDDVLVAPTVVGGQLYGLVAEERGIADALFVLGRGLDRGRVGVEGFVKQTRSLAREQFLKKALIKKIAKGMALEEY